MGVLDFLFEGSPPPAVNTISTGNTQLPEYYQEYTKGIIAKANALAAEPYSLYGAPRIAATTADQNTAYGLARDASTGYKPTLDSAISATQQGGTFNPAALEQYKSPYITGVADRIAELGNRNLTENLLPQIQDQFIAGGQRGSSRAAEFSSRAIRDTANEIAGNQAGALQQAQDAAMKAYGDGQTRQLQSGQQMGALSQTQQQLALSGAAGLEAAGLSQQQQDQRNLDLGYQDFQEQRDAPWLNLERLNAAARGLEFPSSTTTTSTGPASSYQPSPLAAIAGLGTGAAALYKALGTGNKRGGYQNYKRGGPVSASRALPGRSFYVPGRRTSGSLA
jgi:hypothetical protein